MKIDSFQRESLNVCKKCKKLTIVDCKQPFVKDFETNNEQW